MANRRKVQSKDIKPLQSQKEEVEFKFADAEQEAKYELELTWCIQKLTLGISSEKDPKKATDGVKYLNTLKNKSVSVIRKRQVMHNLFGDYRTKMKKDEKSHVNKISFTNDATTSIAKSKFVKKSAKVLDIKTEKSTIDEEKQQNDAKLNYFKMPTGNANFKFNFDVEQNQ